MANKYYDLAVHIADPAQHLLEKTSQDGAIRGSCPSHLDSALTDKAGPERSPGEFKGPRAFPSLSLTCVVPAGNGKTLASCSCLPSLHSWLMEHEGTNLNRGQNLEPMMDG